MPDLHVSNVPEDLYERIRWQAQAYHRSIRAQVLYLLERALPRTPQLQDQVREKIRRRRSFRPSEHNAPDNLSLLSRDRDR